MIWPKSDIYTWIYPWIGLSMSTAILLNTKMVCPVLIEQIVNSIFLCWHATEVHFCAGNKAAKISRDPQRSSINYVST